MNQVYRTLPDDRPIRSLHVIEDVEKCPEGYIPVSKTYDQDSDADLGKESGIFGRKYARYLCISKTKGIQNLVVQSLAIIGEKETPSEGFKTVSKTYDSDQKAWKKKQLCYKFAHVSICETAVTDIIVLSRMKKAPEEFTLLGEINGMTLCYKTGKTGIPCNTSYYPQTPYPVLPFQSVNPCGPEGTFQQNPIGRTSGGGLEKVLNGSAALHPLRPAPKPPTSAYATISGYSGLEGVPFILNPKFNFSNSTGKDFLIPKIKTKLQIDEEYNYEFRTEHET